MQKSYTLDHLSKKTVRNTGERPLYKVEDAHDAIVSRVLFEQTQKEIAKRAKKYNQSTSVPCYPFTGLIVCGRCGKHFGRKICDAGTPYAKPAWYCSTSKAWGKQACNMAQHIPEDLLTAQTCKVLGLESLDGIDLRDHLTQILIPEKNTLVFVFKDGSEKRLEWQHRSRRESWTPEMKEKARQQMLARHAAERKKKEEVKNGS